MKCLVDTQRQAERYVSSWIIEQEPSVEHPNGVVTPVFTECLPEYKIVVEVLNNEDVFPVYSDLIWVDAPEGISNHTGVESELYYDTTDNTIKLKNIAPRPFPDPYEAP